MDLTPAEAAAVIERHDCSQCQAPAGSPCRTRSGKTATRFHTARFTLVPALRVRHGLPAGAWHWEQSCRSMTAAASAGVRSMP